MLKPGAKIAIVAPGSRVDPEKLNVPLSRLHDCGWEYLLGEHVYDQHRYYAGSRDARLRDLIWERRLRNCTIAFRYSVGFAGQSTGHRVFRYHRSAYFSVQRRDRLGAWTGLSHVGS